MIVRLQGDGISIFLLAFDDATLSGDLEKAGEEPGEETAAGVLERRTGMSSLL